MNCWPSMIFTNLMLLLFKKQKLTALLQLQNCFWKLAHNSVYRKDRNLHGGSVMLLVHKDIQNMPITELEKTLESVWIKVFANKTSQYVASWYRQPGGTSEDFQLDHIRNQHKGKKLQRYRLARQTQQIRCGSVSVRGKNVDGHYE